LDRPTSFALLRIIYLFTLSFFSACLFGQHAGYKIIPPQYELEHIKLNFKEDPGIFTDITEDSEGYLWLPGAQGLHVFDGRHVTTYRNDNKAFRLFNDSGSNWFPYFTMRQNGNLWIADKNNRYFEFIPAKRKIIDSFLYIPGPDETQFRISSHPGYGLFFTQVNTRKNLITLYNKTGKPGYKKLFETTCDLNSGIYYQLVGNNHWIINGGNAIRISPDGKKVSRYSFPYVPTPNLQMFANDSSIYIADNLRHIIYTWNESTDQLEIFLKLPVFEKGMIQAFYVDNNKVYLGSNLYLFIIDIASGTIQDLSPQFTELARKEVPNNLSEALTKFYRHKDGSILLLTLSNIFRVKKKLPQPVQFRQQADAENKSLRPVSYRALAEDNNKNIYASYYTGILKKSARGKTFSGMPVKQYLKGDILTTYSLNYWNGNLLWNNIKIELATNKHRYLFDSVSAGHCTQLLLHDSLWMYKWGTRLLHCYDLKRDVLTSYSFELITNGRANNSAILDMNDIVAAGDGENLWVSSHAYGLCLVSKKGKLIKQYSHETLSTTDDYFTDLELAGNHLWFGCTDGLGVLNTTTGKISLYKNPVNKNGQLFNRNVFSIQPDSMGNFYLGSSHGLLYFDTKTFAFYNLPEGHPLSTPEFNRASVFKTSDGRYYFGSTDGLYAFTPGELEFSKSSEAIRPIKLTGISIFNNKDNRYHYLSENLDSLDKLMLNPFDNNIEFSLSVPEFYRNIYYSYRIKGQGDTWTEYKPENKILLYGLQPGDYTLEIKASTSLSDEHASFYSLPIEMKQVWYKKVWVIILFSLAGAALLFGLLRYRFNQKVKRQKDLAALRTKISSDLHDDVGTILSGLAMQSQMLTYSAKEEQKESLKEISDMSREAMEHMRDTVWAMDSRKDKFENLVDRMRDFAEKNLPLKKMTHEFIIENVEGKKFIDPEKRQAIYLIFKEAITNILKHSDGKHVKIFFTEEKYNIRLSIRDDGSAKPPSHSDGLGMSNMKMRAEKISGTLTATYDNGFLVELIL
jgi:two-component sensor histidine kinase